MKRYKVSLTKEEQEELQLLCGKGKHPSRRIRKAHILLEADRGQSDDRIAENLDVSIATIERVRKRFVEGNLILALGEGPRQGRPKKFDGIQRTALIALACTAPPCGRSVWTAELLAERMIELGVVEQISSGGVRMILNQKHLKPWQKQEWCIPSIDSEYVWRMEEVLELYADPLDEARPVVCFDESPCQLIEESRPALPQTLEHPCRVDYEYERRGTVNLFLFVQPLGGWRHVKITSRRCKTDFACCMLDLATVHFPAAEKIRVVPDNLNTHTPAALYEILPPDQARRIVRRLEFYHTPKHASWLNMAEMEFSVLQRQCLAGRYLPTMESLRAEVLAWEARRNVLKAKIEWMFGIEDAREKMGHLYPKLLASVSEYLAEQSRLA